MPSRLGNNSHGARCDQASARSGLGGPDVAPREFHVSRAARRRYGFDEALYTTTGNVILPGRRAAQLFAQRMNEERDVARRPESAVQAGQINAMALLDEILHSVVRVYRDRRNPSAFARAVSWLSEEIGPSALEVVLARFADQFPPLAVHLGQVSVSAYLNGSTSGVPNREILLEELLMLWLENENPAYAQVAELFDDSDLETGTLYPRLIERLREFFAGEPSPLGDSKSLVELLREPVFASPDSLAGQLRFVMERWSGLLADVVVGYGDRLGQLAGDLDDLERGADGRRSGALQALEAEIARSLDLIAEENRPRFLGPGPAEVPSYEGAAFEPGSAPERYTADRDWMPELVLIAKNTYVWLDQLSRKHGRPIHRLDQIPDEELDLLARWGVSGLWFIGIWERSKASARIKQMTGNPEAISSAYSVHDYVIADDLGGPAALDDLRARGRVRGIRIASDMVPNHTAIDSRWVIQHPDWFIGLDHSPFPAYTFGGPNLSSDERVGVYIEDHYFDRSDAAVVFKRVDTWTGAERYIYHGNDGSSIPWVDTAQLDYLNPETREAVIQTILHVARQFPIVRFDAAMVLTNVHLQRLWYPEPGKGGDIPSRSEHGLTRAEFDRRMPAEFWREVVDRVAVEAPDTLLLAEAFWFLEGYFVRTLGMHRVYNSAFMNMLRDEENAKYRQLIKNTLEYDPEILSRYVNFMSNPDERTAIDQFGRGDKYIGVAVMMATLPGLPMLGHGQVEGFAERYGMEYRRAYHDETPDAELVGHHEREIAPLLKRRHLFSGVDHFYLYDFVTADGAVDENVFAYSNRAGEQRSLIVYHNRFADTRGWIRQSVGYTEKLASGERRLIRSTLAEGLGVGVAADRYLVFRDRVTGLEYIRSTREIADRGLYLELGAYGRRVFVDLREVESSERAPYARLAGELGGRGTVSVDAEARRLALEPLLDVFRELVAAPFLSTLLAARQPEPESPSASGVPSPILDEVEERVASLVLTASRWAGGTTDAPEIARRARREVAAILRLASRSAGGSATSRSRASARYWRIRADDLPSWSTLLVTAFARAFRLAVRASDEANADWLDAWALRGVIADSLMGLGLPREQAFRAVSLVGLLARRPSDRLAAPAREGYSRLVAILETPEGQRFVGANRHAGVVWYNREALIELRWWVGQSALLGASLGGSPREVDRALVAWRAFAESVDREMTASEFHLDHLLQALADRARRVRRRSAPKDPNENRTVGFLD